MDSIPFVDLKIQYQQLKHKIDAAIGRVLDRAQFIVGPEVERFEKRFANFCQTKYAVGVSSGTAALHLSLLALDIGSGDEVITVPNSFFATTEAILLVGARPVFVDVDPETQLIDILKIESAITKRTRAILPVHLFGQMADMKRLVKVAKKHQLAVIEDACQAHGASLGGRPAGSWGDIAAFSFYPSKNLDALGDAGAVVTNRRELAERVRLLRDHGSPEKYLHNLVGHTLRINELNAAVLNVKIDHLSSRNKKRRTHADLYNELLSDLPLTLPPRLDSGRSIFHLYVIRTKNRDSLARFLAKEGIATGIHYPIPIHLQKAVAHLGYRTGDFPVAENLAKEVLSLPMYPELEPKQVEKVAECVSRFFATAKGGSVKQ